MIFLNTGYVIVIKVGTKLIADKSGFLEEHRMNQIAAEVVSAIEKGWKVILVSSGAIAAGMEAAGLERRPSELVSLQAVSAIGQSRLMERYAGIFSKYEIRVAQVLLTRTDISSMTGYGNARNTLLKLLNMGFLPIVNENDTVAVEEIKFGDNDTLAALVGGMVKANRLALLTDIEGFFREYGNDDCELMSRLSFITEEHESLASGAPDEYSVGGMLTKLQAAKIASLSGIRTHIASGRNLGVIESIIDGNEIGTYIPPCRTRMRSKRHWIAFAGMPRGEIEVDEGAKDAVLKRGKSLLAAGIVEVTGDFEKNDVIDIVGTDKALFARGLSGFSKKELGLIAGKTSAEIESVLGKAAAGKEAVNRDLMVVFQHINE